MSISFPSYRVNLTTGEPITTMRQKVDRLEQALYGEPQVDCPVRHFFAPGQFAREITIPKGVTLIGAVHKVENLAILSKGSLELVTDEGTVVLIAPAIVTVKPGAKNCALALEESVWTNFYATEETDLDRLCEQLTFSTTAELLGGSRNPQLLRSGRAMELEN